MERRKFLKDGCLMCLGIAVAPQLFASCKTALQTTGNITENGITVTLDAFIKSNRNSVTYRDYIVVRNEILQYPICVYRLDETTYSALYMQCSHQGAELQVAGDRLTCPAHGSEFDHKGMVQQGPAGQALRSFPVTISGETLFIDLRKQS